MESAPIVTPLRTVTCAPSQHRSPIRVGSDSPGVEQVGALRDGKERQDFAPKLDVVPGGAIDERVAPIGRRLERLRENSLDLLPALGSHTATLGTVPRHVKQ